MKVLAICMLFVLSFYCTSFSAEQAVPTVDKNNETKTTAPQAPNLPAADKPESPEGMVFIKGGCFEMGDLFNQGDFDETPVHTVCIDDFHLGKYEVTNADFEKFVKDTEYQTTAEKEGTGWGVSKKGAADWEYRKGINWRHPLSPDDDISGKQDHPVVQVSWEDAQAYTSWLARKTGKKYRLPTEAEWEYAARNRGKKDRYSWKDGEPTANIADETAKKKFPGWLIWERYDDGYVHTAPVGKYRPNELGVYDMIGNVWEWVHDWYGPEYYNKSPRKNPRGPSSGEQHVIRGGSWISGPDEIRLSLRFWGEPEKREDILGFRVALPSK